MNALGKQEFRDNCQYHDALPGSTALCKRSGTVCREDLGGCPLIDTYLANPALHSRKETSVTVADGKYRVLHTNGQNFRAERHGEPWRDLTGNGLVLALVQEIEHLRGLLPAGALEDDPTMEECPDCDGNGSTTKDGSWNSRHTVWGVRPHRTYGKTRRCGRGLAGWEGWCPTPIELAMRNRMRRKHRGGR